MLFLGEEAGNIRGKDKKGERTALTTVRSFSRQEARVLGAEPSTNNNDKTLHAILQDTNEEKIQAEIMHGVHLSVVRVAGELRPARQLQAQPHRVGARASGVWQRGDKAGAVRQLWAYPCHSARQYHSLHHLQPNLCSPGAVCTFSGFWNSGRTMPPVFHHTVHAVPVESAVPGAQGDMAWYPKGQGNPPG